MLKNVFTICSSSFLLNTVTFSPRLFTQSSYLDQKHNVKKKLVKFNKHHKPKPKKILPAEAERPRSELTEKFRAYIENLILASVRERERLLAASLPEDILKVTTQICPPNIWSFSIFAGAGPGHHQPEAGPESPGRGGGQQAGVQCEAREGRLQQVHAQRGLEVGQHIAWSLSPYSQSPDIRPGMLVTVALIEGDQGANVGGWRTLDGILTEVTSAGLSIGLNNLGGWILDSFLGVTHTGTPRLSQSPVHFLNILNLETCH